ncbi:hypothetical protein GOV10_06725, partial [Candidatus Woesearchaeota archaeon]|nr:hypothetical protein [Candidatus Woesearchaeota archaeon]
MDSIDAKLSSISFTSESHDSFTEYKASYRYYFALKPDEVKDLAWIFDVVFSLRQLFTLLIGRPVQTEDLRCVLPDVDRDVTVYRASYQSSKQPFSVRSREMIAPAKKLG